jgi:exonuclease SbcD
MRILHTADWHLGKIFKNVNFLEDQAYILEQLIDLVRQYQIDVLLIAGDIYDRSMPPAEAQNLFDKVVSKICIELKTPIIAIAGNHDNPERVNYFQHFLKKQQLYIKGKFEWNAAPVVLHDDFGAVHFHLIPYIEPQQLNIFLQENGIEKRVSTHQETMQLICEQISTQFKPNERHIAIGHSFIAGGEESESERALTVGGAAQIHPSVFEKFNYTAQGHLHKSQSFLDGKLKYSGSLLKYSFSEVSHQKGAVLVELDAKGHIETTFLPLIPKRNMWRITGKIENLQFIPDASEIPIHPEDYLEVILTNKSPVMNAMSIVQQQYPNALSVQNNWTSSPSKGTKINKEEIANLNEISLFERFYENYYPTSITEEERSILEQIRQEIQ